MTNIFIIFLYNFRLFFEKFNVTDIWFFIIHFSSGGSPDGWTPLTLVLYGLFSLVMWPWGWGALITAEAANWALAESRVFELDSPDLVDYGADQDRICYPKNQSAQTQTSNQCSDPYISDTRQIYQHAAEQVSACCIFTNVSNINKKFKLHY